MDKSTIILIDSQVNNLIRANEIASKLKSIFSDQIDF